MPETANVSARFVNGYLQFTDQSGNIVANIFPSNMQIKTVTTATSLVLADMGKTVRVTVSDTIVTLPLASTTTLVGGEYTIQNMCNNGGQIDLVTVTTETLKGAGISTTGIVGNTGLTHVPGDSITVAATGSSGWYIIGLTGTWASTT